ncbi:MAG: 4Fe-4S binding protein, partial [Deltaproteobacteria bacterium]|nr:4Fe-4S binding protein [Deltaproteobacteria bacterium]
ILKDESKCCSCGACVARCPFKALSVERRSGAVLLDLDKCYGCGVCRHVCSPGALALKPRDEVPAVAGQY